MSTASSLEPAREVWRPPPQGAWTYDDYARMPDKPGVRYEVIEGRLYMAPAPMPRHQIVLGRLLVRLQPPVEAAGGIVLIAPCDLRLAEDAGVVQPDLIVVGPDRVGVVKDRYVLGVPSLLIEVLSPSNTPHDVDRKWKLYLKHRVPEYWIVDPHDDVIEPFVLREDVYASGGRFGAGSRVESEALAGVQVAADEVFAR